MKQRSKNLLITGGAGFIGSNYINYILSKYKNINVFNLDKLTYAGDLNNIIKFNDKKNYFFIEGDICDFSLLKKIFNSYKIDGVVNFAAESHVDNSIKNPQVFIKTNINGVFNLLSICNKFWMNKPFYSKKEFQFSRFHQVSTDEVYGSIPLGSVSENSEYKPNSPYSASKASADLLVRSFNKTYGLNTTISISSNNYGINQHSEKFIPKILESLKNNSEVNLYGDGTNIRNWINVLDNCKAIDKIFNYSNKGETYNIGTQYEISNIDLIKTIYKLVRKKPKINFIQDRFGHDYRYSLDSTKIYNDLGWKSSIEFKDGIKKLIKNYE